MAASFYGESHFDLYLATSSGEKLHFTPADVERQARIGGGQFGDVYKYVLPWLMAHRHGNAGSCKPATRPSDIRLTHVNSTDSTERRVFGGEI